MSFNAIVESLKKEGEDFEFYPTTDEILQSIKNDLLEASESYHSYRFQEENKKEKHPIANLKINAIEGLSFSYDYDRETQEKTYKFFLDSILKITQNHRKIWKTYEKN